MALCSDLTWAPPVSHSREPARQERAVCVHHTLRVKNNLDSTAVVSPLKWGENFKLGQSRVYIMAYVRNTFSFLQTPNVLLFSSSLFLQAGGMANNFTSALKLINWVETAVSHQWNWLKLEAMKQHSATAHICLVGVRAPTLPYPLLVSSMCWQWPTGQTYKQSNPLRLPLLSLLGLGFFHWPTEYSGLWRPSN